MFFYSPLALTPGALDDVPIAEKNGEVPFAENVYEWEQEGAGSCPAGRAEGCVFLISDGRDVAVEGTPSCSSGVDVSSTCLIGTDTTGSNVFFTTADQLVPGDTDTQLDFYDARICEPEHENPCVTAAPAPLAPCSGEACHGIPPATPGSPNAALVRESALQSARDIAEFQARSRPAARPDELGRWAPEQPAGGVRVLPPE